MILQVGDFCEMDNALTRIDNLVKGKNNMHDEQAQGSCCHGNCYFHKWNIFTPYAYHKRFTSMSSMIKTLNKLTPIIDSESEYKQLVNEALDWGIKKFKT